MRGLLELGLLISACLALAVLGVLLGPFCIPFVLILLLLLLLGILRDIVFQKTDGKGLAFS